MTILLSRSSFLPSPSSYDYWCAVGNPRNTPELSRRLPGFEFHMEEAFDVIQQGVVRLKTNMLSILGISVDYYDADGD